MRFASVQQFGLPAKSNRQALQFGYTPATSFFMWLEANPTWDILIKDLFGTAAPRIAVGRTKKERLDVATTELGNNAITFAGIMFAPKMIRHLVQRLSKIPVADLIRQADQQMTPQVKMARLGVAFGFMLPFAAAFWALPFFRNWLTLKREKTADFEILVGLASEDKKHHVKRSYQDEIRYQLKRMWQVLGIGGALGAASVLFFGLLAKNKSLKPFGPLTERFFKAFELKGRPADQLAPLWATIFFWTSPAYLGALHASRSRNELKEWLLKYANSVMWYSLFTPIFVKPLFLHKFNNVLKRSGAPAIHPMFKQVPSYQEITTKFKGPVRDSLLKINNWQAGIGFIISLVMLGLVPQLINIYLTQRRYKRQLNGGPTPPEKPPSPQVPQKPPQNVFTLSQPTQPFPFQYNPTTHTLDPLSLSYKDKLCREKNILTVYNRDG